LKKRWSGTLPANENAIAQQEAPQNKSNKQTAFLVSMTLVSKRIIKKIDAA